MLEFFMWGGTNYVIGDPEKFRTKEAAASEWVYRREMGETCWGQRCPLWGSDVGKDEIVIWTPDDAEQLGYWSVEEVERMADE